MRFSDRFTYQPCEDKRHWFRPYIASNEDQLVPDNIGIEVGTDQLLGPLQLQLSYRTTQFFSDNDREDANVQSIVYIDAVLERWHSRRRRSELRFSAQHLLEDNDGTTFSFNLVNYFNHRRGYRDFDSNQLPFKSLKEHRAARHYYELQR